MRFSQIPGLEKEKSVLINSVKRNHVAHAQLFFGISGGGALPLALAYAQYVNCEHPQEHDSCGACPSCSKYEKFIHPDLNFIYPAVTTKEAGANDIKTEKLIPQWRSFLLANPYSDYMDWMTTIGAENKQGNINVKESRAILKKVSLKAFEAKYKVVVIWMPELMNPQSANALLKVLEEPPENTLFLLISYDAEKLLPTIISRTQKFSVRQFNPDEVIDYLGKSNPNQELVNQAAQLAGGSLNAGLKSLNHEGNDLFTFFRDWMRLCFQKNMEGILSQSDDFQKMGRENQKNLFHYGIEVLRNVALQLAGATFSIKLPQTERHFVEKFSTAVNIEKIEHFFALMDDAHYNIMRNANPKITFITLSIEFIKVI